MTVTHKENKLTKIANFIERLKNEQITKENIARAKGDAQILLL